MDLKRIVKILQRLSPKLTASIAFNFISKPKNRKIRPFEKSILKIAKENTIRFKSFKIKTYTWGEGTKTALLVHGWGGRASNFGAIIPKLLEKEYKIIGFDGPCHGASTKKKTNFFEMADLVKLFLEKEQYDLVITHSMGSVFSFTAMNSLQYKINQMIVLTTPNRFLEFIELAVMHFGLTKKTTQLLIKKVQKTTTEYDLVTLKASSLVKNIDINKATFIHDISDKVISIEKTKQVSTSLKKAEFIEVEGTGHYRMLWAKKVIAIIEQELINNKVQKVL